MPERILKELEAAELEVQATRNSVNNLAEAIGKMVPRHEAVARRLWVVVIGITIVALIAIAALFTLSEVRANQDKDEIAQLNAEIDCRALLAANVDAATVELLIADSNVGNELADVFAALAPADGSPGDIAVVTDEVRQLELAGDLLEAEGGQLRDALNARLNGLEGCSRDTE